MLWYTNVWLYFSGVAWKLPGVGVGARNSIFKIFLPNLQKAFQIKYHIRKCRTLYAMMEPGSYLPGTCSEIFQGGGEPCSFFFFKNQMSFNDFFWLTKKFWTRGGGAWPNDPLNALCRRPPPTSYATVVGYLLFWFSLGTICVLRFTLSIVTICLSSFWKTNKHHNLMRPRYSGIIPK